jgi:hypothetical protein
MKYKRAKQLVAIGAVAAALVGLEATPAFASVYKQGGGTCPTGDYVVIEAYYSGSAYIYWPAETDPLDYQAFRAHGDALSSSTFLTHKRSTSWTVRVDGGQLNDTRTSSVCEPSAD